MEFLANNKELLQSKISNNNIDLSDFLHRIQFFYNDGFQIFRVVEKVLDVIPNNKINPFLRFFVKIYIKKTDEIEKQFRKNKKLNEMVLPLYKKIVEMYDPILE